MTDEIFFTREHHLGLVTLNRPQALNALTLPMILALQHQLQIWQDDRHVHAVVVRAEGTRAFCAGGDVRAIYNLGRDHYQKKMEFFEHEYRLNQFIHDFEKPYIAWMNGITMGGGVGISLHGSHPIASEHFVFAMPETGIGFYPDIGASHLLSRCPGFFGVYLGLTGSRLSAAEAQALGLVKHVMDAARFPAVMALLLDADLSTDAHRRVSDVLRPFSTPIVPASVTELTPFVNACFRHTNMDAIFAALDEGASDWHRATRHILEQKSPLSLKVTLEQLQRAKGLTMRECLQMDHTLTSHFMRDPDFAEGVRALLVDKDNVPHWQPATLSEVTQTMVDAYFETTCRDEATSL